MMTLVGAIFVAACFVTGFVATRRRLRVACAG